MNWIFHFFTTCFSKKFFVSFSIALLLVLFLWDISHASETWITQEDANKLVNALNWFIAVAATLLWLITAFITLFTYPWWTNGSLFGLTEYLRDIWVLISNVVYFIFAFILITIAFMNIIGKWDGNWELKQALPRFIVWVLIVPFTWFLVQFILSVSAVLTVAVLSLPYDIFRDKLEGDTNSSALLNQGICKDIIINLQSGDAAEGVSLTSGEDGLTDAIRCRTEEDKVSIMQIVTWEEWWQWVQNSMFWIISVYTYGILRVQELTKVKAGDLRFYKELIDLILKIFFDIFFIVVYLILMVALMLALFTRWIKLWIFIMFSPIFWLLYFFGKSKEWFWESWKNYNVKEFISLAMVPVYVSAALAFWFVFILVATEGLKEHVSDGSSLDKLDLWWFQLEIKWSYGDGELNLWVIGKLIVQIFWVAILWIAVMAALRASEATKTIVEPIYKFWQSMWQLAAAAPTYAPIIPAWNGEKMSVAWLWTFWQSLEGTIAGNARWTWSQLWTQFWEAVSRRNNAAAGLNAQTAPHREATIAWDITAIDRTLTGMQTATTRESIADRQFRQQFIEDLNNLIRDSNNNAILQPNQRTLLTNATTPEDFADKLAIVMQQLSWTSRQNTKDTIRQRFGIDMWSMNQQAILRALWIWETWTPPPAWWTPPPTTVNVTVSGTSRPIVQSDITIDRSNPTSPNVSFNWNTQTVLSWMPVNDVRSLLTNLGVTNTEDIDLIINNLS